MNIQVDFCVTHITRITSARDFGEFFLGTFRYAATEFYLEICFTDYSSYIKRISMDIFPLPLLRMWVCAKEYLAIIGRG